MENGREWREAKAERRCAWALPAVNAARRMGALRARMSIDD
jgi:hypothetical protein